MLEALLDRRLSPRQVELLLHGAALDGLGQGDHAFGRIWSSIEEQVLDMFEQVLGNFLIDSELPGVDDPHVHAGPDGMVEKG